LVMVQREVGERLAAVPGTSLCGIPSVLASYWGQARVVGSVSAEVFLPRPRVESVLVRLDRSPEPTIDADFSRLAVLVRAGFGKRRKMLRGSLAGLLTEHEIAAAGVAPTDRAEQLDMDAWGRLARA
jgi:16S rRNA (adenine1518-N6/adenine1519-N6)-dimethyltransferase